MTKQEAFELLEVNGVGLAALLNIKPAAVYQWSDEKIPLAREYQVLDLAAGKKPILKTNRSVSTQVAS